MSKYNIYPEFSDQVIARYRKVVTCAIAGTRLDPHDTTRRLTFLLESDEKDFDVEKRQLAFNYDNDIIELYSDIEMRMFRALNKPLFAQGMIAPYEDAPEPISMANVHTDEDLKKMLVARSKADLSRNIAEITSWATIGRLIMLLTPNDPQWKKTLLEEKQHSLVS